VQQEKAMLTATSKLVIAAMGAAFLGHYVYLSFAAISATLALLLK
jgi:hypothetical protein